LAPWFTAPKAYFAGEQARLHLVKSDTLECARLRAVLFQLTSKLQVELEQPHKLNCEDGQTSASRDRHDLLFEFRVPDVKRKTRFEWRLANCGTEGQPCQGLLSVFFVACEIQTFLDQQEIEFFERAAPSYPGAARTTLVVQGDRPDERLDLARHMKHGSVILLRETRDGLPHIKSVQQGPHRLVSVELPILAALRDQPTVQEMFIDLLKLSLE
jgi:hypothetical protein